MCTLESPEYYHQKLLALCRKNKYANSWKARIETNTNRHPNCDGSPWGWYEVWPLDTLVGYWSGRDKEKRDDLKDVDIDAFNAALAELDKEGR